MNRTENKFDLEQLLGAVEHAGRDSRRQQQLSKLIDSLAAEEAGKHKQLMWRRWSIGLSVAACIALFVTTIVKVVIPADDAVPSVVVAEQKTDSVIVPQVIEEAVIVVPTASPVHHRQIVSNAIPSGAEHLAEVMPVEAIDTVDDVISEGDTLFDSEELLRELAVQLAEVKSQDAVSVEEGHPELQQPVVVTQNSEPKTERRSWFRLRRSKPSKMDGTMLAFRLM